MTTKQILIGLVIVVIILAAVWYFKNKNTVVVTPPNSAVKRIVDPTIVTPVTPVPPAVTIVQTTQAEGDGIVNAILQAINSWMANTNSTPTITSVPGLTDTQAGCIAVATYAATNWLAAQPGGQVSVNANFPIATVANPLVACWPGISQKKANCIANTIFRLIQAVSVAGSVTTNVDPAPFAATIINCSNA